MEQNRLVVIEETESGYNILFKDTKTGETLNIPKVAERIEAGMYTEYEYFLRLGKIVIRRIKDGKEWTNLG